jgi:hypothetical protein
MFSEMLKSVQSGFSRFFTPQRLFILVIFSVLAWFLLSYSDTKSFKIDSMSTGDSTTEKKADVSATANASLSDSSTCKPGDLLPDDVNCKWGSLNNLDMKQGDILNGDMLQAGYHIGLDTIGQTLKNANLQLRSDPIIPKQDVGPWNQSTYEPDYGRIPLEVGYGPSN